MKKILSFTIVYLAFSLVAWSQWTSDVMNNTTFCNNPGQKFSTVVTPGLNGQVFVAWLEANPAITVKMQLINADGTLCWDTQGLTISSSLENENPVPLNIISDDEGNAFIVWYNSINGTNGLYASKMSSSGDFLWGFDGVTIYETELYDFANTSICQSHVGNLLIASEMFSMSGVENDKIMLQKLGNDGAISWGNPIMIEDPVSSCGKPRLVSSGTDGSMVSFTKSSGGFFGGVVTLWVQKIDESGNALFGEGKVIYNLGFMTRWQNYDALSGGEDDMLIAWHSYANENSSRPASYLQHISSEGVISWQENGVLFSSEPNIYSDYPRIAGKNQNGETVVFWNHRIDLLPYGTEIFGQKLSSTGERLWTDFGKKIISNAATSGTVFTIDNAFINDNQSFLIYDSLNDDNVSMNLNQIIAVGIDSYGNFLWGEPSSALSLSNTNKSYIVSTSFTNNQSVVCWVETDSLWDSTIKGQNFNNNGIVSIEKKSPQNNDVKFLPNPVSDVLTFLSNSFLISVNVYDITGHRILAERNPSITSINLSQLNPGVYIVQYMTISGKYGSRKIIKN